MKSIALLVGVGVAAAAADEVAAAAAALLPLALALALASFFPYLFYRLFTQKKCGSAARFRLYSRAREYAETA